jgi:hypothetical protein
MKRVGHPPHDRPQGARALAQQLRARRQREPAARDLLEDVGRREYAEDTVEGVFVGARLARQRRGGVGATRDTIGELSETAICSAEATT